MRVMRWVSVLVGVLALATGALALGARFADGPIALLPGGPFQSGEWVEDPEIDWSFVRDVREIELQSGVGPSSRTTWVLFLEGRAYIPCSLGFPPFKRWHREALQDPEAVVRIEGKRYRRTLRKVENPTLHRRLSRATEKKYGGGPISDPDGIWFFLLDAPS